MLLFQVNSELKSFRSAFNHTQNVPVVSSWSTNYNFILVLFAGIALKREYVGPFFSSPNPCPSLPSIATDDRKHQFQCLVTKLDHYLCNATNTWTRFSFFNRLLRKVIESRCLHGKTIFSHLGVSPGQLTCLVWFFRFYGSQCILAQFYSLTRSEARMLRV